MSLARGMPRAATAAAAAARVCVRVSCEIKVSMKSGTHPAHAQRSPTAVLVFFICVEERKAIYDIILRTTKHTGREYHEHVLPMVFFFVVFEEHETGGKHTCRVS